jgi:hypothetical protein
MVVYVWVNGVADFLMVLALNVGPMGPYSLEASVREENMAGVASLGQAEARMRGIFKTMRFTERVFTCGAMAVAIQASGFRIQWGQLVLCDGLMVVLIRANGLRAACVGMASFNGPTGALLSGNGWQDARMAQALCEVQRDASGRVCGKLAHL